MLTGAVNIAIFAAFSWCVWPVLLSNAEFKRVCRTCRLCEGGKNGKMCGKNGKGGKVCGNNLTAAIARMAGACRYAGGKSKSHMHIPLKYKNTSSDNECSIGTGRAQGRGRVILGHT
jgi:hypothetical protein